MSLGCPIALDPCQFVDGVPSQYHGKPRFMAHITADIERSVCLSQVSSDICGAFNCETATGAQLTLIGDAAGWPRTHCNSKVQPVFGYPCEDAQPSGFGCTERFVLGYCEGVTYYCGLIDREDYTFEDDDLYRSFIKAKIAKDNSGVSVPDICNIIQALWGPDAFIVRADGGVISVSAGRDLTTEEQCLLTLYNKVICPALGVRLEIFCVAPTGPTCPPDVVLDCVGGDTGTIDLAPITSPVGDTVAITFSGPSWVVPTINADGSILLAYSVPVGGSNEMFVISATDCLGTCETIITIICDELGDPIAPPNITIDCDEDNSSPQNPIAPANIKIDCDGNII